MHHQRTNKTHHYRNQHRSTQTKTIRKLLASGINEIKQWCSNRKNMQCGMFVEYNNTTPLEYTQELFDEIEETIPIIICRKLSSMFNHMELCHLDNLHDIVLNKFIQYIKQNTISRKYQEMREYNIERALYRKHPIVQTHSIHLYAYCYLHYVLYPALDVLIYVF